MLQRHIFLLAPVTVLSFIAGPNRRFHLSAQRQPCDYRYSPRSAAHRSPLLPLRSHPTTVFLEAILDDERVKSLFAWISRAISGDIRYDDARLAVPAIFGDLPDDSEPVRLVHEALSLLPTREDEPCGMPYTIEERERSSLGPLGAGQWSGQTESFAHSILDVRNLTCVEEWERSLPRTCRQNLRKAQRVVEDDSSDFTVTVRPILGDAIAPHSSSSHFRCVVEHEVRLINRAEAGSESADLFFDALFEAVQRFVITTRMAGTIYEYRYLGPQQQQQRQRQPHDSDDDGGNNNNNNNNNGRVVAFLHEIRKGRTLRGQWFYATDDASRNYLWFHSIRELVRRAVEEKDVDVLDLGPNGVDGQLDVHAELKRRYGFDLVEDWPEVADYRGPFW